MARHCVVDMAVNIGPYSLIGETDVKQITTYSLTSLQGLLANTLKMRLAWQVSHLSKTEKLRVLKIVLKDFQNHSTYHPK